MPTPTKTLLSPVRDKCAIIAENSNLKGQIVALSNTLAARDASISVLTARAAALESENGQLRISASDGVIPATPSPAVSLDHAATTCEAMEARLGQETDPQEIVRLAREIDAMKAPQAPESWTSRRHRRGR